jgi:hypothetical protein
VTKVWCKAILPEFWPPSCPNSNPLDYYVWSVCERDVKATPPLTAASLMAKTVKVMANLPRDTVAKSYKQFRPCIKAIVKAYIFSD